MSKKQTTIAKRILIYGDSNVWGANFASKRICYSDRWVNRLGRTLRGRAQVTADGVRGRVAGDFRTDKPHKNGLSTFTTALQKADNFDLIIIALGTN
ncbi:MAG: arylesterase, partial [Candidatus Saccharimonas sp.]